MAYKRSEIVKECNRVAHMLDHRMQVDRQIADAKSYIIVEPEFKEIRKGDVIRRIHL
jgi:hypothetical protein